MKAFFSQSKIEEILNSMADPVFTIDGKTNIRYVNSAFCKLLGYTSSELIGKPIEKYIGDLNILGQCMLTVERTGECLNQETIFIKKNGQNVHVMKNVRALHDESGIPQEIIVSLRDLTEIDILNKDLQDSREKLKHYADNLETKIQVRSNEVSALKVQIDSILSSISDVVWSMKRKDYSFIYISNSIETISGHPVEDFYKDRKLWMQIVHPNDRKKLLSFFSNVLKGKEKEFEFRVNHTSGRIVWMKIRAAYNSSKHSIDGVAYDVTEEKKNRELIEFLAYHDPLTKLPNRSSLEKIMNEWILNSPEKNMGLIFLDMDNFKNINDSLGHEVGDKLLIQIARRLESEIQDAIITHFGGDEFVVLIPEVEGTQDLSLAAHEIALLFSEPFEHSEGNFYLASSMGVAMYPHHGVTVNELIKNADAAMHNGKAMGRSCIVIFQEYMNLEARLRLEMEHEIRLAIRDRRFVLYYQPIVKSSTNKIVGFEALVRLKTSDGGLLQPDSFIPIAVQSGMINDIGRIVLDDICRMLVVLQKNNPEIYISINISGNEFQRIELLNLISNSLSEYELPSHSLSIEITEDVILNNFEMAEKVLNELKRMGLRIAFDDFGTGYSSLEYLARLPIDVIKIDKSFILNMDAEPRNRKIISALISLGHNMNIDIVAEGIEKQEQHDFLCGLGCDFLQGFLLGRPMPGGEIQALL